MYIVLLYTCKHTKYLFCTSINKIYYKLLIALTAPFHICMKKTFDIVLSTVLPLTVDCKQLLKTPLSLLYLCCSILIICY